MPAQRLREDLALLRAEIDKADAGDRESLAGLAELARQIEDELERERMLADPQALMQELEDAVSGFEATHPNLSAIVNNLLTVLASIGV